jgi:hypothetical protein
MDECKVLNVQVIYFADKQSSVLYIGATGNKAAAAVLHYWQATAVCMRMTGGAEAPLNTCCGEILMQSERLAACEAQAPHRHWCTCVQICCEMSMQVYLQKNTHNDMLPAYKVDSFIDGVTYDVGHSGDRAHQHKGLHSKHAVAQLNLKSGGVVPLQHHITYSGMCSAVLRTLYA